MESVFLFCFWFGAIFTLVTTALGLLGAGLHGVGSHLPGAHPHALPPGAHGLQQAAHGSSHAMHALHPQHGHGFAGQALAVFLNPSAILVGLSLFGAAGYVALHFYAVALAIAVVGAAICGLVGTATVGGFIAKLRQDAGTMRDEDYVLAGTLARVTIPIAADGVGEIAFEMGGIHRAEGARAVGGGAIAKGTAVVVMAYERGIALVEPLKELTGG